VAAAASASPLLLLLLLLLLVAGCLLALAFLQSPVNCHDESAPVVQSGNGVV